MKELVSLICGGLGLNASELSYQEEDGEQETRATLSLPLSAVERLDGRDHRTAKAFRQVLSAAAAAQGRRFHLVARARD